MLGVIRGVREASIPRVACIALAIVSFGAGLFPYLYFLIAPDTAISWRHMHGLGDLRASHAAPRLRNSERFPQSRAGAPRARASPRSPQMLGRTWLWVPLLLGLGTLGAAAVRPAPAARRAGPGRCSRRASCRGAALVSRFNIPPSGIGLVLCHRFHLLPAMLLALPVAVGLDWVGTSWRADVCARASPGSRTRLRSWGFIALAVESLPLHSPAVERAVTNMLAPLPPSAV